jgi:hypothetical protein
MQTRSFNKLVAVVSLIIVVAIIILSWVLVSRGPRVRNITTEPSLGTSSKTIGTTININFDRAINQGINYDDIMIEPEVEFNVNTSSQAIQIVLLENLESDSQYVLKINQGIYDKSNQNRSAPTEYILKTGSPSFSYLQRNYDDSVSGGGLDKIFLKQIGQNNKEIFAASEIVNYTANDSHVVASVRGEENDDLYIIDRSTNSIDKLDLGIEGEISIIDTSPRGKIVMYAVEYDQRKVSTDFFNKFSNIVYSLNTETRQTTTLTHKSGESVKAKEIFMSPNGQSALIRSAMSQDYYVVSPHNDYDPIYLGAHDFSFGFNQDGTQIIFVDAGVANIFDIRKTETSQLKIERFGKIDGSQKNLFFSQQSYSAETGLESSVVSYDFVNKKSNVIWQLDSSFGLTDISPSFDAKYIAAQVNPLPCDYDLLGLASQCRDVITKIINTKNDSLQEEVEGFNLIWLP